MGEPFDFVEALREEGVVLDKYGHGENGMFLYRVRWKDGEVDVARQKDFDRWANSVDCTFSIPKTRRAYEKRKRLIEDVAEVPPVQKIRFHVEPRLSRRRTWKKRTS